MNLKKYYSAKAVGQRLKQMQPLKTTVVDNFFTRKVNHPFDKVGRSDIMKIGAPAPLIARGAGSLAVGGGIISLDDFEPFEIANHEFFTAADINRLKGLDELSIQTRLSNIDDDLRRIARSTTEAISAVSRTGTILWPVALESGGFENYRVKFGDPHEFVPDKLWSDADATIKEIFHDLDKIETTLQEAGYGSNVKHEGGKEVYSTLLAVAEVYGQNPKAKIRVEISKKGIDIGGFLIEKMAETFVHPETNQVTYKVDPKKLLSYCSDASHTLFYCALDDLDAKLQPLPYYSKPITSVDPSGIKIIGRSKPFPVPVVKAICWSTLIG